MAQVLLYVRYVHEESIEEELIFVALWKATPKVKIHSLKSMKFIQLQIS